MSSEYDIYSGDNDTWLERVERMPECELVYKMIENNKYVTTSIFKDKFIYENMEYRRQLKEKYNIQLHLTSSEYKDNMVAEYLLLYKKD